MTTEITISLLVSILIFTISTLGLVFKKDLLGFLLLLFLTAVSPTVFLTTAYFSTNLIDLAALAIAILGFASVMIVIAISLVTKLTQEFESIELDFYRILRG